MKAATLVESPPDVAFLPCSAKYSSSDSYILSDILYV